MWSAVFSTDAADRVRQPLLPSEMLEMGVLCRYCNNNLSEQVQNRGSTARVRRNHLPEGAFTSREAGEGLQRP